MAIFDQPPHINNSILAFSSPEIVTAWKNDLLLSVHFWVPRPDRSHPILTMPTPKIFHQLLIFVIMYQYAKNKFIPSAHSWDTVNFRVLSTDWSHPFLTMLTAKNFQSLFNLCEIVPACKKSVSSITSSLGYSQF